MSFRASQTTRSARTCGRGRGFLKPSWHIQSHVYSSVATLSGGRAVHVGLNVPCLPELLRRLGLRGPVVVEFFDFVTESSEKLGKTCRLRGLGLRGAQSESSEKLGKTRELKMRAGDE